MEKQGHGSTVYQQDCDNVPHTLYKLLRTLYTLIHGVARSTVHGLWDSVVGLRLHEQDGGKVHEMQSVEGSVGQAVQ